MMQTILVYVVVAIAAGWVGWSLFLRGMVKRRAAAAKGGDCGGDCACGD